MSYERAQALGLKIEDIQVAELNAAFAALDLSTMRIGLGQGITTVVERV